jgi:hypothetical protein
MKYLKKFNESFGRTFEVPSEFEMAIQELGPNPDADTIISICNELFEETPIIGYSSESNLFMHEDGSKSTPEDLFLQINDYLTSEEDY